jgi:hypothetical protein
MPSGLSVLEGVLQWGWYIRESSPRMWTVYGSWPNGIKLGKAKRGGYRKFRYLQFTILLTVLVRGSRTSPHLLRLCFPIQPRREVLHAAAPECTDARQPNQETSAKVSQASVGAHADQTTSKLPFHWWGVHSTLFAIHQLEGLPEPHSGRRKLLTGKSHSMQSYGVTMGR